LEGAFVKLFLPFVVAISIVVGTAPVFGFSLQNAGKGPSVNRWPYSFGDRYIYDNAGSRWNYESGYRDHQGNNRPKYWQPRFEYELKVEGHTNENFQDLMEHLSEHQFHHVRPYH